MILTMASGRLMTTEVSGDTAITENDSRSSTLLSISMVMLTQMVVGN